MDESCSKFADKYNQHRDDVTKDQKKSMRLNLVDDLTEDGELIDNPLVDKKFVNGYLNTHRPRSPDHLHHLRNESQFENPVDFFEFPKDSNNNFNYNNYNNLAHHQIQSSQSNVQPPRSPPLSLLPSKRTKREKRSFRKLLYDDELYEGIKKLGLKRPSDLQEKILTILRSNQRNDLLIKTNLFTLKELSYLIVATERVDINTNSPQVIICLPTFELAQDIFKLATHLLRYKNGYHVDYISRENNVISQFQISSQIIITSPGCLSYLIQSRLLNTHLIRMLILDELEIQANSEKGFKQMNTIKQCLSTNTQTIYFSSTHGEKGLKLANFLTLNSSSRPFFIYTYNFLRDNEYLKGVFKHFIVKCNSKMNCGQSLVKLLQNIKITKIMICVISKKCAQYVYEKLIAHNFGIRILVLTSEQPFSERAHIIETFREDYQSILVSIYPLYVNVDLGDLDIIINYDLPFDRAINQEQEYLHKVSLFRHLASLDGLNKPKFVINLVNCNLRDERFPGDRRKIIENFVGFEMIELTLD